jgi:hypothetical protein
MSILSFSEYIKGKISITEDIGIQNISRDVIKEKDELLNQVVELVGSTSASGIQIQIEDITTRFDKASIKVLIRGTEHIFSLKNGKLSIEAHGGGILDGATGTPDEVLHMLLGIKDGSLSEK